MGRKWVAALAVLGVAAVIAVMTPGMASAGTPTKPVNATTRVKMLHENMCLTALGGGAVGARIGKYLCNAQLEQVWDFIGPYDLEHGGAYYLMRNKKTQLCLVPDGNALKSAIIQVPCDEAVNAQHWGITSGDGQMIGTRANELHITVEPAPKFTSLAYQDKFLGNQSDFQQCWTFPEKRPDPGP